MSSSYITDSIVLLKPGYPPHLNITALFSLDIITEDVIDDDHCYSVNVTLFLPLFDDCLTFCCRINVTVQCDTVAIRAETVNVIHSDNGKSKNFLMSTSLLSSGTCRERQISYLRMKVVDRIAMSLTVKKVKTMAPSW